MAEKDPTINVAKNNLISTRGLATLLDCRRNGSGRWKTKDRSTLRWSGRTNTTR